MASDAEPVRVLVTGAAGQIGYSLLYMIARGDVFGLEQRVTLVLLDIPPMITTLEGVVMELQDCSMPLVAEVIASVDEPSACKDVDVAFLVGAFPRKEGMERKDLLKANARIFESQGRNLDQHAKKNVKIVVVGNPANTNALICKKSAPGIPAKNFTAMTRLDHNRATAQIAARLNIPNTDVKNVIIWGNHSSTQYPDVSHATAVVNDTKIPVREAVKDDFWLHNDFIEVVRKRGGAVIAARKLSSAMSAAKAVCDHVRDWIHGTAEGVHVSMAVPSDGSYGIPEDLIYSFPVKCSGGTFEIVQGLSIDEFSREKMDASAKELVEEKEAAFTFLTQ